MAVAAAGTVVFLDLSRPEDSGEVVYKAPPGATMDDLCSLRRDGGAILVSQKRGDGHEAAAAFVYRFAEHDSLTSIMEAVAVRIGEEAAVSQDVRGRGRRREMGIAEVHRAVLADDVP